MSNICTPYYDNQYAGFATSNGAVATNIAILHPNTFYIGGSWSSNNSLESWNKGNTAMIVNSNTVYKTIFSPSPTGYVEPKSAAFTAFTSSGGNATSGLNINGSYNKGWNFYCLPNYQGITIFFSTSGFRDHSNSSFIDVGNGGYYWSVSPCSISSAIAFSFNSVIVNTHAENNSSYGFLSRPVLE